MMNEQGVRQLMAGFVRDAVLMDMNQMRDSFRANRNDDPEKMVRVRIAIQAIEELIEMVRQHEFNGGDER